MCSLIVLWAVRIFFGVVLLVLGLVFLVGCYPQQEWLGRQLSGIDCRYEKLDAQGRCVPYVR